MRRALLIFIIILLAVGVAYLLNTDVGYVLISLGHMHIETTVWFALFATVLAIFVIYIALRLLVGILLFPYAIRRWHRQKKRRDAMKLTHKGMCQLATGDWEAAEKNLLQAAAHRDKSVLNYIGAATAASKLSAHERRDAHLEKAPKHDKLAELAIELTKVQLQIDHQHWVQAQHALDALIKKYPKQIEVIKKSAELAQLRQDWPLLQTLLPKLRKYRVYSEQTLREIEKRIYQHELTGAIESATPETVSKIWQGLPKHWRFDPDFITIYVDYLIITERMDEAAILIEKELKREWSSRLVGLYGRIITSDATKQLSIAEKWVTAHEGDPSLLLCLAQLSLRAKFYGKAKEYAEKYLVKNPSPAVYKLLAQVYESLGDTMRALNYYRKYTNEA